jgi:hypothetical protein
MSSSRPFSPGQAAAALPMLRSYRDLLTEQFLGGTAMARLLGAPPGSRSRAYTPPFPPEGPDEDHSIEGFGIGREQAAPKLVIYANRATRATFDLEQRLEDAAIPATLVTGVHFTAAGPRPVNGGTSIGHGKPGGASGALGCVVSARQGGGRYGLTCNHVIAELNVAKRGDDVWAPGTAGGGTKADRLGILHDFAPIDFTAGRSNMVDAALAAPGNAADLDPAITHIGMVAGVNAAPSFGDKVQKSAPVSGYTSGHYLYQINAQIAYTGGQKALFRDLLGIVGSSGNFASQGDSGALVLDHARFAVGMLISVASGLNLALASAIKPTLDYFDVDIV